MTSSLDAPVTNEEKGPRVSESYAGAEDYCK